MSISLRIISGPEYSVDDSGWEHHAYVVELRNAGRSMRSPWKQGLGITSDPSTCDVLGSLFLDAAGYDNSRDFSDWANEYGMSDDSISARATYDEVARLAGRLARLLGVEVERLDNRAPRQAEDAKILARRYAKDSTEVES